DKIGCKYPGNFVHPRVHAPLNVGKGDVNDARIHHLDEGREHDREGHNPFIDPWTFCELRVHGFCDVDERAWVGVGCSRYGPLLSATFMVTSRDAPTLSGRSCGGGWSSSILTGIR